VRWERMRDGLVERGNGEEHICIYVNISHIFKYVRDGMYMCVCLAGCVVGSWREGIAKNIYTCTRKYMFTHTRV